MALNEFEGTVMLVSHDRALLREVCDEFWLVAGGKVEPFDGDLDDYQRWLLEAVRAAAKGIAPPVLMPALKEAASPQTKAPAAAPQAKAPEPKPAVPAPPPAAGQRRDDRKVQAQARAKLAERSRPLRTELAQIDTRLAKLATERADVEAALAAATLPAAEIAESGRRLNHIAAETTLLEERWLELSAQIEKLT